MKFKTTDDGALESTEVEGAVMPILVKDDGTEEAFDLSKPFKKIADLTQESVQRRKKLEKLEAEHQEAAGTLEVWKGLGVEPDEVKDLIKKRDSGDLEPRDLDQVREQVATSYKKQLSEKDKQVEALTGELQSTKERMASAAVGSKFGSSTWFTGKDAKTILPPDVAYAYFGKHFRLEEDGEVAGYLDPGKWEQRILVEKGDRVGEPAGFDDAIDALISRREDKDRLLAGSGASGSGAPSNGHHRGSVGGRQYNRAEFEKLPPPDQARVAKEVREGKAAITD